MAADLVPRPLTRNGDGPSAWMVKTPLRGNSAAAVRSTRISGSCTSFPVPRPNLTRRASIRRDRRITALPRTVRKVTSTSMPDHQPGSALPHHRKKTDTMWAKSAASSMKDNGT